MSMGIKMKKISRIILVAILILSQAMLIAFPATENMITIQAAKIKINRKSATIVKGKTLQLAVDGTTQIVSWSSDQTSIAVVSMTGLVTAKKKGKAVITAQVAQEQYTCKITVKNKKTKKELYKAAVKRYKSLVKKEKKIQKGYDTAYTTQDMMKIASDTYELWDNELNYQYKQIRENLSSSKFAKLQSAQRKWIKKKEKATQYDAVRDGTLGLVTTEEKAASMTKKRLWWMIKNYLK